MTIFECYLWEMPLTFPPTCVHAGFTRAGSKIPPMTRFLTTALVLLSLSAAPLAAAEEQACLTRHEQQAAVERGNAVSLAAAIKAARGHILGRQVVKAQLCQQAKGLVYVLTVLAHDGKVTHARVDAASGGMIDEL